MGIVEPTGATHAVGNGEFFFSTTDAKGIIELSNSVFVRMSRYSAAELAGAPHNIIRHPEMPGGAFRLMWDSLLAGKPFCAYVDNLAADGSTYRVFATVTPLADGYLSVRTRPMAQASVEAVYGLYAETLAFERELRASGAGRHEVAEKGRDLLTSRLSELGIASYDDFIAEVMPAELEAALAEGLVAESRPAATGVFADMLQISSKIDDQLLGWAGRMGQLQAVADRLTRVVPRLIATVEENKKTSERIRDAEASSGFATASVYLRVWADIASEVEPMLTKLAGELEELRASCAQTRFRIALGILHNHTIGQFVAEVIDQGDHGDEHRQAIGALTRAMHDGVREADTHSARNVELAQQAGRKIAALTDLLSAPQMMIHTWLGLAGGSAENADLASEVKRRYDRTERDIEDLTELASESQYLAVHLDTSSVEELLRILLRHQDTGVIVV